mgnify:CR=1 FL=1
MPTAAPPPTQRLQAQIHGRVQGVWFRGSTQDHAVALGLKGWVRNCPDGTVELVAEGPRDHLEALLAWCHRGPSGARVERVESTWTAAEGGFDDFAVRR